MLRNETPNTTAADPAASAPMPVTPPVLTTPVAGGFTHRFNLDVFSGIFTGTFTSVLFHPFDKAMHDAHHFKRHFFDMKNFEKPFHGIGQTLMMRPFTGGLYYILQNEVRSLLHPFFCNKLGYKSEAFAELSTGLIAGGVFGAWTNTVNAMRYFTWGNSEHTFKATLIEMWRLGGYTFVNGIGTSILRDMIFGGTYEVSRGFLYRHKPQDNYGINWAFVCDMTGAAIASISASPVHYIRSKKHRAIADRKTPPSATELLCNLWQDSKKHTSALGKLGFFQKELRIGMSSARVAVGVGLGQIIFDAAKNKLEELTAKPENTLKNPKV
jgi:hypothetical protein